MNVSFTQLIIFTCRKSVNSWLTIVSVLSRCPHASPCPHQELQFHYKTHQNCQTTSLLKNLLKDPNDKIHVHHCLRRNWEVNLGVEEEDSEIRRRNWGKQGWLLVPNMISSYGRPCDSIWVTWHSNMRKTVEQRTSSCW